MKRLVKHVPSDWLAYDAVASNWWHCSHASIAASLPPGPGLLDVCIVVIWKILSLIC